MLTIKTTIVAIFYSVFGRRVWVCESVNLIPLLSCWRIPLETTVTSRNPIFGAVLVSGGCPGFHRRDIDPFKGFGLCVQLRYVVGSIVNGNKMETMCVPVITICECPRTPDHFWRISEHGICVLVDVAAEAWAFHRLREIMAEADAAAKIVKEKGRSLKLRKYRRVPTYLCD